MTVIAYGAALALIWVLAWGSFSAANVLGGIAVAALLLWFAPDTWPRSSRPVVRPVAIARFGIYVLAKVIESNVIIAREILARRSHIHTGVMAVPLTNFSDGLITLVANVMALTPGTIPIQVTRDPIVVYVHVLHMRDVEAARRDVQRLADLAYRAFAPAGTTFDGESEVAPEEVAG